MENKNRLYFLLPIQSRRHSISFSWLDQSQLLIPYSFPIHCIPDRMESALFFSFPFSPEHIPPFWPNKIGHFRLNAE
jgi:hypothetical protein